MVEEAKLSKIARLRYSRRFEELFAEMQSVRQAMKLEEAKLSRIQPEIQASHEIIISLKQKRIKLRNAAMDLGSGLQGSDYRYYNNNKNHNQNNSSSFSNIWLLWWTTTTRVQQISWETPARTKADAAIFLFMRSQLQFGLFSGYWIQARLR